MKKTSVSVELFITLFITVIVSMLIACGGGSTQDIGSLSLGLTDATTAEYQAVYITIREVQACRDLPDITETEDQEEWIVVATPKKTYNLLDLVNGLIAQLGETDLPAGDYHQLRLILGTEPDQDVNLLGLAHPFANYIIEGSDEVHELTVPSGEQTGIKIVRGFTIDEGQSTDLVLDFNVVKSIVQAGRSGKWILKPTIRVVDNEAAAYLSGIVDDQITSEPIKGVLVSVQQPTGTLPIDGVVATTVTDESGTYLLLLDPGTYTIVAGKKGYKSGVAVDLTVQTGEVVYQDFSLEVGQGEGSIHGLVNILNGSDIEFVTISIRNTLPDGTVVEVATQSVANGGTYHFDLPEGLYLMFATYTVGDQEMTLEAYEAFVLIDGVSIEFDILFENIEEENADDEGHGRPQKVTICHKGRTITISSSALNAHLNHGDTIGACSEGETDDGGDSNAE